MSGKLLRKGNKGKKCESFVLVLEFLRDFA
jgi:hypothetical protein